MVKRPLPKRIVIATTVTESINAFVAPHLPALRAAGWEVHLIAAPGPIDPVVETGADSVTFVPMTRAMSPGRDTQSLAAMTRALRRIRPTVLVGSTPKAGVVSMVAGKFARVPVRVFHIWGARWDGMDGIQRTILIAADKVAALNATDILCVSESMAKLAVEVGIAAKKPVVLGRGGSKGVNMRSFKPPTDYLYQEQSPRLGFIGRLAQDKGLDVAVAVFEKLRVGRPGASMEVIGGIDDAQPVDPELIANLHRDGITWSGLVPISEIPRHLRNWDLLVFPSRREGLPNAVIEAAACGVPTVGWDVTGVRDAVCDKVSGLLAPLDDLRSLQMLTNQALDPIRHSELRQGALALAADFDSTRVVGLFVDYLDHLHASASSRLSDSSEYLSGL